MSHIYPKCATKITFKLITEPAFFPNTCYVRLWVFKTKHFMNYNIPSDIKFSFNNKNYDSRRVLSSKTKFLDSYLYECVNLTSWIRYKDCKFRWEEVLFFLDIPMFKDNDLNLKLFSEKVQEKFNGNFLGLLKKIEIYFNQEDDNLNWKRKKEFSYWYIDSKNLT